MKFPISNRVDLAKLKEPRIHQLWIPKFDQLPRNARVALAARVVRRVEPLLGAANGPLPQSVADCLSKCVTAVEKSAAGDQLVDLRSLSAQAMNIATNLAAQNFGYVAFSVMTAAHFAVNAALARSGASRLGALAVQSAAEAFLPICPPGWTKKWLAAVDRDFATLLDTSSQAKSAEEVTIPDYYFALHSEFDVQRQIEGKSIADVAQTIDAKLVEYFRLHPSSLRELNPRQFEEVIAEMFRGFGFDVELTKATRDGGRDIVAVRQKLVGERFLIECKRYQQGNPIRVQPVRALLGVVSSEKATKGVLVTTSNFTPDARRFLDDNKWVLEGKDFEGLKGWLEVYQQEQLGRIRAEVLGARTK